MLRNLLSGVIRNSDDVRERQEAVCELTTMLNWRQRFLAEGMVTSEKIHIPEELITWGLENKVIYRKKWVIAAFRMCPVVTIPLVTAGFVMNVIPLYIPSNALLIQFGLVSYKVRERYRIFSIFENYNEDLRVYYKMLKLLKKCEFKFILINKIKVNIRK